MTQVLNFLAAFISGVLGALGMGGGGTLIFYLSLYLGLDQLESQGINLMFFLPTAALAAAIYIIKKELKLKPLIPLILWGLLGAIIGSSVSGILGGEFLRKVFSFGVVCLGLKTLLTKGKAKRDKKE